jgi:UDP-N-acetylglucosamine 2-epimerase (non-hydrolysing)
MHILHLVGARPNFMKAAPVMRALAERTNVQQTLVHSGQHYDFNMSEVFFRELEIVEPTVNLNVGSGTQAVQTSEVMMRFEPVVQRMKPDLLLVYGDVNSTLPGAVVCSKLGVKIGHVEAGLRSFDRSMPEEINRLLTDQISDLLFTPSEDANRNLAREGVAAEKVHFVGNVMIDTLIRMLPAAEERLPKGLPERYALATLHRPSNVDDLEWLAKFIVALERISKIIPVIFTVHPRTRQRLSELGLDGRSQDDVRFLEPLPYLDFLGLQFRATLVITDSGGIQEETSFLQIPCLTLRANTERPVTVELGTNSLVGRDTEQLRKEVQKILSGRRKNSTIPPLWDGKAAERIADIVIGNGDLAAGDPNAYADSRSSL